MRSDTSAVEALALRQCGVVTYAQAVAHGVTRRTIQWRLGTGEWRRHLGCLLVTSPESPEAAESDRRRERQRDWRDAWALGLRLGPTTVITGPTALRLQGLLLKDPHVIAVHAGTHTAVVGATLLRDTCARRTTAGPAFRLAGRLDALVDTLLTVSDARAIEVVDHALQLHWVDAAHLDSVLESRRIPGRKRMARLDRLVRHAREGTRSAAERRMKPLLPRIAGYQWHANDAIRVGDRIIAEGDFVIRELRLCIEVDGRAHHSSERDFENDRARQNALVAAGWTVLRFTWHQIVDEPARVTATIHALAGRLAARSA